MRWSLANKYSNNWCYIAPKDGESQTKTVDGVLFKFCQTYRCGKGHWTTGESLHRTKQHDPTKAKKCNDNNNTNNNNNISKNNDDNNNSVNLAEVPDFQSINFGFDLNLAEILDFDSFDFGLNTSIDVGSLNKLVCKPCIPTLNSTFQDGDDKYSILPNQLKDYHRYA